ncbi:unnamed protein product [Rhizoctonia solani]|uniref:Uncharacterized protein n=1 Tax=Rhizoctonia solani TaxID=456999 RepID=A0A8H3BG59_9AGAM|nr:unnamed protein product [Rhizoctonia solani]CAE6462761.1 unnamed protein product [Rhizoctonia solani]
MSTSRPRDSYTTSGSSWRNSIKSVFFLSHETNNQHAHPPEVNELNAGRPPSETEVERGMNNQGKVPEPGPELELELEPVKKNKTIKRVLVLVFLAMVAGGVALIVVFVGRCPR